VFATVKNAPELRETLRLGPYEANPKDLNDWLSEKVHAWLLAVFVEDAEKVLNDIGREVLERALVDRNEAALSRNFLRLDKQKNRKRAAVIPQSRIYFKRVEDLVGLCDDDVEWEMDSVVAAGIEVVWANFRQILALFVYLVSVI
jgi:hypothetical protein